MLRSVNILRGRLRKLRQLWEQCDLFEPAPVIPVWERPEPGTSKSSQRPKRRAKPRRTHPRTRTPRTHPQDMQWITQLTDAFHRYNAQLFGGQLHPVPIRVSRRMKHRLGHYMTASSDGHPPEIAISRRHIRTDSWDEVLHTLVHEMVHQWQDENGLPLDHGAAFRKKAREVGISARATRPHDAVYVATHAAAS